MTDAEFVPTDFDVPDSFDGRGFRLEPLGPQHNDRDHEAWMASIEHIRTTPGFDSPEVDWPTSMSLEANLADLLMHAEHFERRVGFTYSVLDGDAVIGCLYLYPSTDPNHDVEARSWVRVDRSEMDTVVWEDVSEWVATDWPFTSPSYAPRF